ncbi:SRPBCC family protein [Mumia quercus]|uniref:SRPBCC family protein n=1 Tax=Mumia quercus TaxID=2976125 RepID=UPI0021D39A11|nr:SRPBCC family protein [Mumia quercus]
MTLVSRDIHATADQVFAVLADGWTYASWVVGASRIREVDADFPAPGARIHHSVGTWPLLIDDTTSVLACEPGKKLELKVRAWPFGEGYVGLTLHEQDGTTTVEMEEHTLSGPAKLLPGPVEALSLRARNDEALRRLAYLAEGRSR